MMKMILEAFLLALALCVDSFVVSTTSAFKSKMSYRHGILMAVVFAFFQGGFPFLGAMLGAAFRDMIASVDHWVAFGLLLAVGGKMVYDALCEVPDDRQLDVSRFGVLCLLGIATSILRHYVLHSVRLCRSGAGQTQHSSTGACGYAAGGSCTDRSWGLHADRTPYSVMVISIG